MLAPPNEQAPSPWLLLLVLYSRSFVLQEPAKMAERAKMAGKEVTTSALEGRSAGGVTLNS